MLAPIILFVYKRAMHMQRAIESLGRNLLASESRLIVFSDAAKGENDLQDVNLVREYLHQQDWRTQFAQVTIIESEENKGLARSVIEGVSFVIDQYRKVIVVEDDLVVSKYFLQYMNGALDYYEEKSDIWSVSGYSFPMKSLEKYPHDVFYGYRGCSWGWGSWKNRWETVDWSVKEYSDFINDKRWIRQFNRGGNDLTPMLTRQMRGESDSWAIRWCFAQSSQNKLTIYPKHSYVMNEGLDGTGTHSGKSREYDTFLWEGNSQCNYEILTPERRIVKEFRQKYSDSLKKKVKRKILWFKRKLGGAGGMR